MTGRRRRGSHPGTHEHLGTHEQPLLNGAGPQLTKESERVLGTPLPELMDAGRARARAEQLTRAAGAAPAIARFRTVVAFVGDGRRATQGGKLTPADTVALVEWLGMTAPGSGKLRTMDDLPWIAHLFHWALATGVLALGKTKITVGPWAEALERDPLAVWLRVSVALLEHGLLDGFQFGWRKQYVELLDAMAPSLLVAIMAAGGQAPRAAIESRTARGSRWRRATATSSTTNRNAGTSSTSSEGSSPSSPTSERHDENAMR